VIATAVLHGAGGVALIDPGPSTSLPRLRVELAALGVSVADVTAVLLTHIHLDHGGATGTLVREQPGIRVLVHERGAPHLADPSKLLASATRLYGDQMDYLWGEVLPVPASAITALAGGERVTEGGRVLDVAYTPGHASHHVSFFNEESGVAFVGDTAGVRIVPNGIALPPTPPPDIDLELWAGSLDTIERWRPGTLFLTHFGPVTPIAAYLAELRDHLDVIAAICRQSLALPGDDAGREAWFIGQMRSMLRRKLAAADAETYEIAGRFDLNWRGLARYFRKKGS
jgi:glyoxylase-like metal-dependent hydrolase (beta-lactamase superfamily II)